MIIREELMRRYHKLVITLLDVALAWQRFGVASNGSNAEDSDRGWLYATHGWFLPSNGMPEVMFGINSDTTKEKTYCRMLGLDSICTANQSTQYTTNGILIVMAIHEGLLRYDYDPKRYVRFKQQTGRKVSRSVRHAIRLTPEGERLLKVMHRSPTWVSLSLSLLLLTLWRLSESAWRLYGGDREEVRPAALIARLYAEAQLPMPQTISLITQDIIPEPLVTVSPAEIAYLERLKGYAGHVNAPVAAFSEFMQRTYDELIDMARVKRIL